MDKVNVSSKLPHSPIREFFPLDVRKLETLIVADLPEFIPRYAHENDACCDLKANIPDGEVNIGFGEVRRIDTGIRIQIPNGFEAQIRCRSGWACKGLMIVNGVGTIDSSFIGRIQVIVTNISQNPISIKHLDKIAQMCLKPVWNFVFVKTDNLNNTERGEAGFGSTG